MTFLIVLRNVLREQRSGTLLANDSVQERLISW